MDRHMGVVLGNREPDRKLCRLAESDGASLTATGPEDDVGAGVVGDMEPEVGSAREPEGELVVVATAAADQDLLTRGGDEEAIGEADLGLAFDGRKLLAGEEACVAGGGGEAGERDEVGSRGGLASEVGELLELLIGLSKPGAGMGLAPLELAGAGIARGDVLGEVEAGVELDEGDGGPLFEPVLDGDAIGGEVGLAAEGLQEVGLAAQAGRGMTAVGVGGDGDGALREPLASTGQSGEQLGTALVEGLRCIEVTVPGLDEGVGAGVAGEAVAEGGWTAIRAGCGWLVGIADGDGSVAGGPSVEAALDQTIFEQQEVGSSAKLGNEVVGDTAADELPLDDAVVVSDRELPDEPTDNPRAEQHHKGGWRGRRRRPLRNAVESGGAGGEGDEQQGGLTGPVALEDKGVLVCDGMDSAEPRALDEGALEADEMAEFGL